MSRAAPLLVLVLALLLAGSAYWLLRPETAPVVTAPEPEQETPASPEVARLEALAAEEIEEAEAVEPAESVAPAGEHAPRVALAASLSVPFHLVDDRGEPIAAARAVVLPQGADRKESVGLDLETDTGDLDVPIESPGQWTVGVIVPEHTVDGPYPADFEVPYDGPRLVLRFTRNGRLRGTVVDESGASVPGSEVEVALLRGGRTIATFAARTDQDGSFAVASLPAGTARVSVENRFVDEHTEVEVLPGEQASVELRIPAAGYVRGTVFDADGAPASDAGVVLTADVELMTTGTDKEGRYSLGPIPVGEYALVGIIDRGNVPLFLPAATVRIESGVTLELDLRPDPERTHELRGHLFLGETPLPDCNVLAFREDTSLVNGIRAARSDSEGTFTIELTGPGAHVFYFELHGGARRDPCCPQRVVVAADQHEVDLHLPLGGIAGRAVDTSGEAVGHVRVVALREDVGIDDVMPFTDGAVVTDKQGRFLVPMLADGVYTVTAYGNGAWKRRTGIRVAGDVVSGIDLERVASGKVTGRVLDTERRPVEDATVFVRDASGELLWGVSEETGADGAFTIRVPAGSVTLFARMWGAASRDTAPVAVLPDKTTDGVEVVLTTGARMHVAALSGGEPVSCAIRVYDDAGRDVTRAPIDIDKMAHVLRDPLSSTQRVVGPLPPGDYEVVATTPSGRTAKKRVQLGSEDLEVTLRVR